MSCCVVVLLWLNDVSSHFCYTNIQELDEYELQRFRQNPNSKSSRSPVVWNCSAVSSYCLCGQNCLTPMVCLPCRCTRLRSRDPRICKAVDDTSNATKKISIEQYLEEVERNEAIVFAMLWASPPCTTYGRLTANTHREKIKQFLNWRFNTTVC
jgi:hypothetical protein